MSPPLNRAPESFSVRREAAGDAPFLLELFAAGVRDMLAPAGLPDATVEGLVAMQHQARAAAYAAQWPRARGWIALLDGVAAGRLLEADAVEGGVHLIDLAVSPAFRRRGIGAALVGGLLATQARSGGQVRAEVAVGNAPSLALFRRLGFEARGEPGAAHFTVRWTAPGCAASDHR